jgi:probable HAF family extracellular repeat protein
VYQNGTYTSLPTSFGAVGGINNAGQIASGTSIGTFDPATGQVIEVQHIPIPTSPYTPQATAINNNGDVLLISGMDAYLYQNGKLTDFAKLFPNSWINPIALNDAGQVVVTVAPLLGNGSAEPGLTGSTQYLYQAGKVQALPGGWTVVGSSPSGQLVGSSYLFPYPVSSLHAAFFQNGQAGDLGTLGTQPGWQWSAARTMSPNGQVVGWSQISIGNLSTYHAFLYQQGTMIDLNSLIPSSGGVTLSDARLINNRGQIVVEGGEDGPGHTYLLTPIPAPVPEPGTLTVFGLLAGALALWRVRGPRPSRSR